MTIRDIAKAAGVSAATVSRIINHKDENISKETRDRVLQIINETEYVPYAKIRDRLLEGNHTLGLALPSLDAGFYAAFTSHLQHLTAADGYSLLLAITHGLPEVEQAVMDNFIAHRVEGVFLFPGSDESLQLLEELHKNDGCAVVLDYAGKSALFPQVYRDFSKTVRQCVELLLKKNYRHIALVLRSDSGALVKKKILDGYTQSLQISGLSIDNSLIIEYGESFTHDFDILIGAGVNAIICQDTDTAGFIYAAAAHKCLSIPEDLSIIAMEDSDKSSQLAPPLTAMSTKVEEMAQTAVTSMLAQLKKGGDAFTSKVVRSQLVSRASIGKQQTGSAKLLVAGSINMDITLKVPHLPHLGETLLSTRRSTWPGGKGANQAIGVSRFGADALLLGRLGNDIYGKQLYEHLTHENINMSGVSFVNNLPTGTAYISVQPDGGSSIIVHPGANGALDQSYVKEHAAVFGDVQYCLVQMEIPMPAVEAILEACAAREVRAILKPSPPVPLSDSLLDGLFLLVPNEEESCKLCPTLDTPSQQAQSFLKRGVQNVIVTLGAAGCLWVCKEGEYLFPAPPFPCIDSTGASDVFISCLAVMLCEGQTMHQAITTATLAASYSVSQDGVQNSILERSLLADLAKGKLVISVRDEASRKPLI